MWSIDEEMQRLRKKLTLVRLVTGTVVDGVVVPDLALPEGTRVTVSIEEPGDPDQGELLGFEAWAESRRTSSTFEGHAQLFRELAACDLP